jgi:hypothetical protein
MKLDASKPSGSGSVLPERLSLAFLRLAVLVLLVAVMANAVGVEAAADQPVWRELDQGLALGEFESAGGGVSTQYRITILRIDPARFSLKLLCAKEHGRERLTTREWSRQYGLLAAVNAGMYQQDGLTHVSFMKNFKHINNRRVSRDNAILAFNPTDPELPEVQIIDRECQDFEGLKGKYQTLIQGIRMISCDRRNVWSPQPDKWSTAAVGMDDRGKVLFLFGQTPLTVHDFINILLSLPLGIRNAMYLEGGPQASLHVSMKGVEVDRNGSLESALDDSEGIRLVFQIPNVLGVVRKGG